MAWWCHLKSNTMAILNFWGWVGWGVFIFLFGHIFLPSYAIILLPFWISKSPYCIYLNCKCTIHILHLNYSSKIGQYYSLKHGHVVYKYNFQYSTGWLFWNPIWQRNGKFLSLAPILKCFGTFFFFIQEAKFHALFTKCMVLSPICLTNMAT